jgi:hypothetical protein
LSEYRQGNFFAAAEWAERSLSGESWDLVKCQAYAIISMARLRLGQRQAAETAMTQYEQLRKSELPVQTNERNNSVWRERVVADLLMRESAELALSGVGQGQ